MDDLNSQLTRFNGKLKEARNSLIGLNRVYDELNGKNLTISVGTEDEKVMQG